MNASSRSRVSARTTLVAAIALGCAAGAAHATTITVTSADDSATFAPCNLRNAITAINYGNAAMFPGCKASLHGLFGDNDTIVFAPALANSTITLQQGQLSNYAPLTIAGSGQVIDAADASRVLYTIAYLGLSNLTLRGGNAGSGSGGGLYADQAFVSLNHVAITSNRATLGGGLAVANGSASLLFTTVAGNASGGGISVAASNVTLKNSAVLDNAASCTSSCAGGIVLTNHATLTATASTIARNTADASGGSVAGAAHVTESKLALINSTVAENSASGFDAVAGALLETQSTSTAAYGIVLTNATLAANTASTANPSAAAVSGGMLLGASGNARATLANSILAANSGSVAAGPIATPDLCLLAGTASIANSLLGNAQQPLWSGNGNVFSDAPGLSVLADHGGPTPTLALRGDSPAIDAGSNTLALDAASQPLTTDQRGTARIVGGRVDIGAYEFPGDHIFSDRFGG